MSADETREGVDEGLETVEMVETSDAIDTVREPVAVAGNERGALYPSVPEVPDPPSYAPIITGLGIAISAWGFLTDITILGLGLLFFTIGMTIWIKELSYEP